MKTSILTVICIGALTLVPRLRAELYVYDPFLLPNPLTSPADPALGQYNEWTPPIPGQAEPIGPHVPMAGQNPTPPFGTRPNFFEGPWRSVQGGGVVHPTSIGYINTPAMGGSARTAPIPNPNFNPSLPADGVCGPDGGSNAFYSRCDAFTTRYLATPYSETANETLYVSFVANFGSTTAGMGFRAIEFFSANAVPGADNQRWLDLGYNEYNGYGNPLQ